MAFTRAKEDRPTPPEVYNYRVYLIAFSCCLGSWMFGYNNGVIGGTIVLPSFERDFHLPPIGSSRYDNITSNIISFLQIGGLVGAMSTFPCVKYLGRKRALNALAAVGVVGAVIQTFSAGRLALMYVGRAISGVALGGATVVIPLYLAELSPPAIRGSIVGIYEINNQLSGLVGYWCNYIVNHYISSTSSRQWQIPLAMQIIPAALLLLTSLTVMPESPRFLVNQNKTAQARRVLAYIRHLDQDHEYISSEIRDFETAKRELEKGRTGERFAMLRELTWKGNRNRVIIGVFLMVGQNLTGINGVNFYTPTIFRAIGFRGTNNVLLASGMYAVAKTLATLTSLIFFIDRAGRRKLLITSAIGASVSLWYIGGYATAANITLTSSTSSGQEQGDTSSIPAAGWVAIVALYIYAASFSIAWNGVVWIYCSEIFRARIKDLAVCLTTFTQWLSQFAVARASPYMLSSLRGGFFFFFAACTALMTVIVYLWVPETKGRSLESMDAVFGVPVRSAAASVLDQPQHPDLEVGEGKRDDEMGVRRVPELVL
ncbi:MFS quinate transporter [Phlyctema vagabunda]|uniref:Quinate transporter n=1 Tax=Phlyctema vagabunda TaxID=108571 RepID=A0ABR4PTL5_9HELO